MMRAEKDYYGSRSFFKNNADLKKQPKPDFSNGTRAADKDHATLADQVSILEQPMNPDTGETLEPRIENFRA
jgi:hypothetical protein